MNLFYNEDFLRENNALHTAKEIEQQPRLWKETMEILQNNKEEITKFLSSLDLKNTKIIFTGAGTSEFVGNTLVPYLRETTNLDMESRATTDIVACPKAYIPQNKDVLLVSFARSGNSPESIAAVDVAEIVSDRVHHLFITCNENGALAKKNLENSFTLLMPKDSNDAGFAMTGSFSCMLLSASVIFNLENIDKIQAEVEELAKATQANIEVAKPLLEEIVNIPTERVVFLGGGSLKGLAQEASLKVLELCAGNIPVSFDTPMGFRHGPKSIVNSKTVIFNLVSQNDYQKKYDLDLIDELLRDQKAGAVITLHGASDLNRELEMKNIHVSTQFCSENAVLKALNYLVPCQMYAFMKSLEQNLTPDNPCPTGEVNRVVKGVTIHDYIG